MATLVASFPLSLPLHSLLVSSWTWLALSLATIATLLRALSRTPISRHPPRPLLPPPPSLFSAEAKQISSEVSSFSPPLQKAHKHRVSSQSTPVLQNVFQSPDGIACPRLGFVSCLNDSNPAPLRFRKVASASKIFNASGRRRDSAEGVSADTIDCKLGSGLRLGFLVNTQRGESEIPTLGLIKEGVNPHHMWTSDVISTCKPLQNVSPLDVPLCFETQSGWVKLVDLRLGSSWRHHRMSRLTPASMQYSKPMGHNEHVVKVWSIHQRNLYKALKIQETSVAALDVNKALTFACVARRNGEISQWDIANQACLSRVASNVRSVFTLCLNAEKGIAIAGNGKSFGLWDYKSPSLIPVVDCSKKSLYLSSCTALWCKGDTLCIDLGDGIFSLCDLRKLRVSTGTLPHSLLVSSKMEAEEESVLWEKLAFDNEEPWDEPLMSCGDAFQKSNSFKSMCTTLVRSLSSSGR